MLLYKYLTPPRLDVLERERIRFTQPAALNDPFELKPVFEKAIDPADAWKLLAGEPIDITEQIEQVYAEGSPDVRSAISLPQFKNLVSSYIQTPEGRAQIGRYLAVGISLINEMTPQMQEGIHSEASERIGILSLTELPTSELMWAHYASQHRGFLIEFDSSAPFFNRRRSESDEFYWLRQVQYRNVRTVPALFKTTGDDLLLVKGSEWAYEREWRMLAPVEHADEVVTSADDTVYLFELPPSSISGVVLGAHASADLRERLLNLRSSTEYSHVRVGEIRFRLGEPRLELVWSAC